MVAPLLGDVKCSTRMSASYLRLARVRQQPVGLGEDFVGADACRLKALHRRAHGLGGGLNHQLTIAGIHAAAQDAWSPQAHQVRRGMIVRRANDRVIDLPVRREPLPDADHVVVKEPDGVQRDDSDA